MSLENLHDRDGDLMEELAKLPLPSVEKLATYLKTNFGHVYCRMTDEEWIREAKALLEAIGYE